MKKTILILSLVIATVFLVLAAITVLQLDENIGTNDVDVIGDTDTTLLLCGLDKVGVNTDVMILLHLDYDAKQTFVLQIPRDTYIKTEEYTGKINGLYGRCLRSRTEHEAINAVEEPVASAFSLPIDGTIFLSLAATEKLFDSLGGVTVNLPMALHYDDPEQGLAIHLEAGEQTLSGADICHVMRYRSGYAEGDLGRIDMQKRVFFATKNRLMDNGKAFDIFKIYENINGNLLTNLSKKDIISIIGAVMPIKNQLAMQMTTLPGEAVRTASGVSYYATNKKNAEKIVTDYLGGTTFDTHRVFSGDGMTEFSVVYDDPNAPLRIVGEESLPKIARK